jgi:tripartite-type tricarboxylate transporter receptor subunit TctC
VLVVNNGVPARTLRELIDHARSSPGKLSYGTPGIGTPHHFGMEQFRAITRTELVHVPYKGSAPALADLMGGQIEVMLVTVNAVQRLIQDGRVRALAVAEPNRLAALRDVPTMREAGVPDYELSAWYALLAPARTPPEVLRRWGTNRWPRWPTPRCATGWSARASRSRPARPRRCAARCNPIWSAGRAWRAPPGSGPNEPVRDA